MGKYNPIKIEKKWQRIWDKEKLYRPDLDKARRPFYNLMMFPYPSAEGLHVGNMYAFVHSDTYGRYMRMKGYDVFEPIGLDGFGIHSENYAIKQGEHILDVSKRTEKHFYEQLKMIGNQYDWTRRLETYKSEYYKWTQWIFIQMFKKGLAYQAESYVNWCPSCRTVLSDEQVISGRCERCDSLVEKKLMKQWFFKITDYAERLLKNLDWINWSERTKTAQRNWIGKSEGAVIKFSICPLFTHSNFQFSIEVFTTRLDTIFGCTYCVLAPEHKLIRELKSEIENWEEVEKYILAAQKKSEIERTELEKEKTGVELKGIKAINPFTNQEIPIFVADYVLAHYGTGAVMAVPAHDERDFEFADKYNLSIIQSIAPNYEGYKKTLKTLEVLNKIYDAAKRENVKFWLLGGLACAFYARIIYREYGDLDLIVKDKEDMQKMVEILEELGFEKDREKKLTGKLTNLIYKNKDGIEVDIGVDLKEFGLKESDFEEGIKKLNGFEVLVLSRRYIKNFKEFQLKNRGDGKHKLDLDYLNGKVFIDDGVLVNSGEFTGLLSDEARGKMTNWLEKNGFGGKKVHYKLRDWCISRQRYWGPPIPMIYCQKCSWQPVPEKDLPVLLPETKDYLPRADGLAPLARNKKFWQTKCPKCGSQARRETDVSDTFLDSSWYFFRYIDVDNQRQPFDKLRARKWLPIDMYIGGHEHAVLHLLYSRFITMFFKDLELIDFEEPYKRFFAHGLLICEGAKMSKSKGNIVNPDEYIKRYGADAVRMYLMFLGDVVQGGDWRDLGMRGMFKFVNRIWGLLGKMTLHLRASEGSSRGKAEGSRHLVRDLSFVDKTIKKVGDDLERLSFNTAIARIMEYVNWYKENEAHFTKKQRKEVLEKLSLMLAPFASHLAEEIWQKLGHKKSIFKESWPKYDPKLIKESVITLVIQVNGKLRDKIEVLADISESDAKSAAFASQKIKKFLASQEPKKVIFVKGRLVNIVL